MTGLAINIKSNVKRVSRHLTKIQKKQIPFAISQALNDTAFQLTKGGGRRGINSVLGKATNETFAMKTGGKGASRFTRTGFKYDKSNKRDLTAWVYFDPASGDGEYLELQVFGGIERPKRKFLLVPTLARKSLTDRFGNLNNKTLDGILKNKEKFFQGSPKGIEGQRGIWERYGRTKQFPSGRKIRMIASYEKDTTYKPLFKFAETVDGYTFGRKGFDKHFIKRLEAALNSRRSYGA
jgi:hypothetical protein